jgi:hypothetical protein
MGKGYADGPAIEERLSEAGEAAPAARGRRAVYGSTDADVESHFIGWADEIDPDALFERGEAWGLSIVLREVPS